MSLNTLFIDEVLIKSRTAISQGIDGKQIKPVIKLAQDKFIMSCLGSTLFNRLQQGIENDDLNTYEKTLLDDYITDCLLWYTIAEMVMMTSFQFFSKGVFQKSSEESNAPSNGQLELLERSYKSNAEFYKQRLIDYLRQNTTLFPEYINYATGFDVIPPQIKAYTSSIYLGRKTRKIASNLDFPYENTKL